jgi:hypothetical protein
MKCPCDNCRKNIDGNCSVTTKCIHKLRANIYDYLLRKHVQKIHDLR